MIFHKNRLPADDSHEISYLIFRVLATDRLSRQMRRNNKFGANNMNVATTIGERKIAGENLCLASERLDSLKLLPGAANGHQCIS